MAETVEKFAAAKFHLRAVIKSAGTNAVIATLGEREFGDIVSVSATFALNTIPTASLVLAIGRSTRDLSQYATIHDIRDKLQPRDNISIFVDVIAADIGAKDKIPTGTYKIFEGFIVGIGYQRSHNNANYVINIVHWLDDLNNSTAINGDWLPGAPADCAKSALSEVVAPGAASAPANVALSVAPTIKSDTLVLDAKEDLWEKVVKPISLSIAGFQDRTDQKLRVAPEANPAAKAALDRMPGKGATLGYYKPLQLRLDEVTGPLNFSQSLATYFTDVFGDPTLQNSFWAKIITEIAPDFMFSISPAVDWALPIPFCAGLRWSDGGKVIDATEYSYANFTTNMSQLLEAVHIVFPIGSNANSGRSSENTTNQQVSTPTGYRRMYASYPSPDVIKNFPNLARGLKLFKQPPRWVKANDAAGFGGLMSTLVPTTTIAPAAKNDLPANVIATELAYEAARSVVADFARHWYCTEVLQQRVGELSGPLRFDIAPGSIVKIMTPIVDRLPHADDHVVASVMSVSYVINAERAVAGTSFTVAHTKTPKEATSSFYTTDRPPLYGVKKEFTPFYDAPLTVKETV